MKGSSAGSCGDASSYPERCGTTCLNEGQLRWELRPVEASWYWDMSVPLPQ